MFYSNTRKMDDIAMTTKTFTKTLMGLGFLTGAFFSCSIQAHTLSEAVAQAVLMGPDVAIQANKKNQFNQRLRQAYAGYLPTLDVNAGVGREHSDNPTTRGPLDQGGSTTLTRSEFNITARQMLFDGFAVKNDAEGRMTQITAEAWRTNGTAQDTAAQVVQQYLEVLLQKKLVSLAKYNLDAHERIYGQIEKRSEGGVGRKADLDQAEGRLALARTNLLAAQSNHRDAMTRYERLVGLPAVGLVAPSMPDGLFPENERAAVAMGLNNNPILRSAIGDVSAVRSAKKLAQANFFPRFDIEGNLGRNHNIDGSPGDNDDFSVMLKGRYNLFKGGADVAKVNEECWRVQEAQEVRNRAHRETQQAVELAWNLFTTARSQQKYMKMHMDAAERTRDAYIKQFNIGQRTLLDVLDSENELYSVRTSYVSAKNQEVFGKYRLLSHLGMLLASLDVELPEAAKLKEPKLFSLDS
jgi:adhesin transport system outer membrane protein